MATSMVPSEELQDRTPHPLSWPPPGEQGRLAIARILHHVGLPTAASAPRLHNARSSAPHTTERPTPASGHISGSARGYQEPLASFDGMAVLVTARRSVCQAVYLYIAVSRANIRPSYGIVGSDSIAYPFNEGCGTAQQYDSYVEAWIYDTAGDRSAPVVIHLVCTG